MCRPIFNTGLALAYESILRLQIRLSNMLWLRTVISTIIDKNLGRIWNLKMSVLANEHRNINSHLFTLTNDGPGVKNHTFTIVISVDSQATAVFK